MDKLRAIAADVSRYLSQLTRRERTMLLAAVGSVVVFLGSVVVATVRSSISRHEQAIAEKELDLKKVAVYAGGYAEAERARRAVQSRLLARPLMLMTRLQQLAEQQGLTVSAMNDRGDSTLGDVKESDVELQIASAPLDKVTRLLSEVERDPHIVKVRKLRLQRLHGDDKSLNVTMTVATYSLAKG